MQQAQVLAHSVNPRGNELLTFKLRMPKFILAEFNTHRMLSRNASSSRAIPTSKYLDEARSRENNVTPALWPKNQKGMQADEYLEGDTAKLAAQVWHHAAADAAYHADRLLKIGIHKQIANRIVEPFVHANVVASGTEWLNFFGLRLDRAAQPEMRALAEGMWRAWNESEPKLLHPGEWHLPFVEDVDWSQYPQDLYEGGDGFSYDEAVEEVRKVSVARCARVSYESFEAPGTMSWHSKDAELHDFLVANGHWSPFEHVATPDTITDGTWDHPEEHGNFVGFRQYRKTFTGESMRELPEEYR